MFFGNHAFQAIQAMNVKCSLAAELPSQATPKHLDSGLSVIYTCIYIYVYEYLKI